MISKMNYQLSKKLSRPLFAASTACILLISSILFPATSEAQSNSHIFGAPSYTKLKTEDGKRVEIAYAGMLNVFEGESSAKTRMGYSSISVTHGLFKDPAGGKGFLVLGQVSHDNHGMALYRYANGDSKSVPQLLIRTHERLRKSQLRFHQTNNGDIFVISNQGVLLCFKAGAKSVQRFELDGYFQNPTKMFKEIQGIVSDDGSILFYSAVDSDYEGKALRDLVRYKDGKFQKIELGENGLSSVVIPGREKLTFLLVDGIKTIDIATGKIETKPVMNPTIDGNDLIPAKIFVRKNGEMISLWRFRKTKSNWSTKFPDGFVNRFAELESGRWVLKEVGLDSLNRVWKPAFAEDSAGRCWFSGTGNGRLLVRHPSGDYQVVETKRMFDYNTIRSISFPDEKQVAFRLNSRSVKTLDVKALLARKPESFSRWLKVESKTPLIPDLNDNLYGIAREDGRLLKISNGQIESIDLPPLAKWDPKASVYLTTDTRSHVWLFADKQNKVAKYDGQSWTVIDGETRDGVNWTARQVALTEHAKSLDEKQPANGQTDQKSAQLAQNYVGLVGPFRAQFGPDHQVLFVNAKKRIEYFDGKKWHSPTTGREASRYAILGQPFFEEGHIRFVDYRTECYSIKPERLNELKDVNEKRPWKKISFEESKEFTKRREERLITRRNPRTLPMSGKTRPYRSGNCWLVLKDNVATIAREDQSWSKLNLVGTPLENGKYFQIYSTLTRSFIFNIGKERYVYSPPQVDVIPENVSLGEIVKPNESVVPLFRTVPENLDVIYRYRLENDPWSDWQKQGDSVLLRAVAKKGKHPLEIQFNLVEYLVDPIKINYEFTTTYSLQEKIDEQVDLLASRSFDDREFATKSLIKLGPAVLPSIQALEESPDVETRVRARKIIAAVKAKLNPIKP